jgi:dinuclear metal center YbgI/SA1388 family protein
VVKEAILKKCNLVIAHHPIIFGGLKKINGKNYVERTIIAAIKNDIAIYAIHTNLDNVMDGVSGKMAKMAGLENLTILSPKENALKKLFVFVPVEAAAAVRDAVFAAGGGHIGNYSECSFNTEGTGTFKAGRDTHPYVGSIGEQHQEKEVKIEVIFPGFLEPKIVAAMKAAHPYEEVAYDIVSLSNSHQGIGAGILGELAEPMDEESFLSHLKTVFRLKVIRHTPLRNKPVKKVALCGGAGSFLISSALRAGADFYFTGDIKYHEFFDANDRLVLADIGHYESEQFTIDLLQEILEQKFPTFAVLKTEVVTNPVHYF